MHGKRQQGVAFAPRTPASIITRDRLVDVLERSAAPLVIVRAPGGTGKSTLIADWVHRYQRPGVWVGIDPSAAQRFAFWQRILDAVVDADLAPTASMLRRIVPSPDMADSLRGVLLRGFNTLPSAITLVIDDFHEVTDPEVHEDLHWLLRSGAPVRLVVATRTVSGLEGRENLSQLDTSVLEVSDLALTVHEVRECALIVGADTRSADELFASFGGWALPTRSALLELARGRAATAREAIGLVEETSDRLPLNLDPDSDYTRFLLRCSVARRLTLALAEEIGGHLAGSHLARLEADGFGGWTSHSGRQEFTIHPVVRGRLERELTSRMPSEVPALRRAYARDRTHHGDALAAAQQFAAVGDFEAIVGLVRQFYGDLVLTHWDALAELIRTADHAALRRNPELIAVLLLQTSRMPDAPRVGIMQLATLGVASAQARFGRGDTVEQLSLLTALLAGQRLSGNYSAAVATGQKIASLASSLDADRRHALRGILPQSLTHAATSYFYSDQFSDAEATFHEASMIARQYNRPWAIVHSESMLALVDAARGDMQRARGRIDSARPRSVPQGWRGTYPAAGYHFAVAYDALERFDGSAARAELRELERHEATIEHWPIIAHLRAVALLVDGTPSLGLTTLQRDITQHASRPATSDAMLSSLAAIRFDLLLADRQPTRAAAALRGLRGDWRAGLGRARLDFLEARYSSAIRGAAAIAWSDDRSSRDRATAMLTVAAAARRLHQDVVARDTALRALDLLDATGLRLPLLAVPLADLKELFSDAGANAEQVLAGVPNVLPAPLSDWNLTPAELRVLAALQTTSSIDGLAAGLHLSSNTVKTHLRQVYRKLGATSRDEALAIASLHGIAETGSLHDATERNELS